MTRADIIKWTIALIGDCALVYCSVRFIILPRLHKFVDGKIEQNNVNVLRLWGRK